MGGVSAHLYKINKLHKKEGEKVVHQFGPPALGLAQQHYIGIRPDFPAS